LESPRKNNDVLLQDMTLEEMRKYFKYPQPEAAKRLGVSLSTLKRRFYALNMGKRWPYYQFVKVQRKRHLNYILNKQNKPEKLIDNHTIHVLKLAFRNNCGSRE